MRNKDLQKWAMIAVLGGSGMGGGFHLKNLIAQLWEPYRVENEKRLEEQRHTRHELERLNYNIHVIQHQLTGKKLEQAIELTNEDRHD